MHAATLVMSKRGAVLAAVLLTSGACSYLARDTPTYERDTAALLDTRSDAVQACYDAELTRNRSQVGKLTVHFTVEKRTGKLIKLEWDRNRSSVSDTLATCVVSALYGLELAEADRREGDATFSYVFRIIEGQGAVAGSPAAPTADQP
jgi:hypothetical protein